MAISSAFTIRLSVWCGQVSYIRRTYNNFSPRLSVAYDVFGKGKTVVRAGFGVFYDAFSQDFFTGQLAYNTFNTGPAYNAIGPNPVFFTNVLNPALPVGAPLSPLAGDSIIQPNVPVFDPASVTPGTATTTDAFTVSHRLRTPYVYNYNLNIQQELLPNTVLEVGYVGSAGRKLFHFRTSTNQRKPRSRHRQILKCDCINSFSVPRPFDTAAPLSPLAPNPAFYVNELRNERKFELQLTADIADPAELAPLQHTAGLHLVTFDRHRKRWPRLRAECLAAERQHKS